MTHAAVYGPRGRLVERIEKPLSRWTPWSSDTIRAAFGALFLYWSARRVVRALRAGLGR
jgi:hypothetical protein